MVTPATRPVKRTCKVCGVTGELSQMFHIGRGRYVHNGCKGKPLKFKLT